MTRRTAQVDERAGSLVVHVSWAGTVLFAGTAALAAVAPDTLDLPALVVSLVLFAGGAGVFVWAFLLAVIRSRTDDVDLTGLFGLSGSAPRRVQRHLLGSVAVEVVVALATAGVRPYTTLAFGILVPVFGLGMAGLWGARYGVFPARAGSRATRHARPK